MAKKITHLDTTVDCKHHLGEEYGAVIPLDISQPVAPSVGPRVVEYLKELPRPFPHVGREWFR